MSESTAKRRRALITEPVPPHVHCHDCGRPMTPEAARQGGVAQAMPSPDGRVVFAMRPVPLCGECWERIHAAEQEAAQRPKIEVARALPPQGLRPA